MKKEKYLEWVSKFGFEFFSWLKVLPFTDERGEPVVLTHAVPIVSFERTKYEAKEAEIKSQGFHFSNSTIHYVEGHHVPHGYMLKALVKTIKRSE